MCGKNWMLAGIILAGLSVVIGAFGAHRLESHWKDLDPIEYAKKIDHWKTGAMYQFFHSLGIVMIGIVLSLSGQRSGQWLNLSAILMIVGVMMFSGSLYLMCLAELRLGMVVPLGGTAFILGWIAFAVGVGQSDPKHLS